MRAEIEFQGTEALANATQAAEAAIARQYGPGPVVGGIRAYVMTAMR